MYLFLDCVDILSDMIERCQVKIKKLTMQQAKNLLRRTKKRVVVCDYLDQTQLAKMMAVGRILQTDFNEQIYYTGVKIEKEMQVALVKVFCLPNLYGNARFYDKQILSLARFQFSLWKISIF